MADDLDMDAGPHDEDGRDAWIWDELLGDDVLPSDPPPIVTSEGEP